MFAAGQTITVVRPSGTDRFGDPLPPTEHTIPGVGIAPGTSNEALAARDTTYSYTTLYMPYDADIAATDRVRLPGETGAPWMVSGEPQRWQSPITGWKPGATVLIEKVTG